MAARRPAAAAWGPGDRRPTRKDGPGRRSGGPAAPPVITTVTEYHDARLVPLAVSLLSIQFRVQDSDLLAPAGQAGAKSSEPLAPRPGPASVTPRASESGWQRLVPACHHPSPSWTPPESPVPLGGLRLRVADGLCGPAVTVRAECRRRGPRHFAGGTGHPAGARTAQGPPVLAGLGFCRPPVLNGICKLVCLPVTVACKTMRRSKVAAFNLDEDSNLSPSYTVAKAAEESFDSTASYRQHRIHHFKLAQGTGCSNPSNIAKFTFQPRGVMATI